MQEVSGSIPLGSTIFQKFKPAIVFQPCSNGSIAGITSQVHKLLILRLCTLKFIDIEWHGRTDMKYSILTIKWGSEFSFEHVNILFRAAKDMSSLDFQFICMTDDPKGLDKISSACRFQ